MIPGSAQFRAYLARSTGLHIWLDTFTLRTAGFGYLYKEEGGKVKKNNIYRNCAPVFIRLTIMNIAGLSFTRAPWHPSPSRDVTPGAHVWWRPRRGCSRSRTARGRHRRVNVGEVLAARLIVHHRSGIRGAAFRPSRRGRLGVTRRNTRGQLLKGTALARPPGLVALKQRISQVAGYCYRAGNGDVASLLVMADCGIARRTRSCHGR